MIPFSQKQEKFNIYATKNRYLNNAYLYPQIFRFMEDYIIREIDRIGEMLVQVAKRLGLFQDGGTAPDYTMADVKAEFEKGKLELDIDAVLAQNYPVLYLVEHENLSERSLEMFVDIVFHSDADESRKTALLNDAINYLDSKGYFSFRLHSFV